VKLKSIIICLQTHETKFEQLSLVTQKLSIYLPRKTYSVPIPTSQWNTHPYDNTPPFGGRAMVLWVMTLILICISIILLCVVILMIIDFAV